MPKIVSPETYLARAHAAHDGKYTYDESTLFSANGTATIFCLYHGAFHQRLANHLRGVGCPACAGRGVDWVERFRSVHGDQYDYANVNFVSYKLPVEIVCPTHGSFLQTPDNHYRNGQGCPKCRGQRIRKAKQMPVEEFIRRATEIHAGRFTYSTLQFDNVLTSTVQITCPRHGVFTQNPVNHLAGKVGCTKCNNKASKGEEEVAAYVGIFAPTVRRTKKILPITKTSRYSRELDIYAPTANFAIEYCGDYHHSYATQETARAGKHKHHQKYVDCAALGIRLLTIYESEWLKRNYAVRRLIRNALGKAKGRLMARKCDLRKVPVAQARMFYDRYHPQGGDGAGEHYGLYWKDKLVACMRFTHGANDRGTGSERVWTLTRYATRITVAGGASRLFRAFVKEYAPQEVKSFSDNRYFSGSMYSQLGFVLEGETGPDYQVWSPRLGLRPKAHYQRRALAQRLLDHGRTESFDADTDPRSEAEVTYMMGCRRLYDCGKKRWLWRVDSPPAAC